MTNFPAEQRGTEKPVRPPLPGIAIRQLWPHEHQRLASHYKRLHAEDRWRRFGSSVSAGWLDDYARKAMTTPSTVIKGAFTNGRLCGVGEAWFGHKGPEHDAEAAFSLEREFQGCGVGDLLFKTIVNAARNRGASRLQMVCMRDNPQMIALARSNSAALSVSPDGIVGEINGAKAKPYAVGSELMREGICYWLTVPLWAFDPTGAGTKS